MAENEDIQVRMRVSLDEDEMERQVRSTEQRLNKRQGQRDEAEEQTAESKEEQKQESFAGRIGKAITDSLSRITGGEPGTQALVGSAVGAGAGVLAGQGLTSAVEKLIDGLMKAAKHFDQFNPVIAASTNMFRLRMRGIAISMSRIVEPAIKQLIKLFGNLAELIASLLKGPLAALSTVFTLFLKILNGVVNILQKVVGWINKIFALLFDAVGKFAEFVGGILPDWLGGEIMKKLGQSMQQSADEMRRNDGEDRARDFNRAFIEALSDIADENARNGQEERREGGRPVRSDESRSEERADRNGEADQGSNARPPVESGDNAPDVPSAAEGRRARPAPKPVNLDVSQNVNFNLQMKLVHEQAVQTAIEQVRSQLLHGLNTVRNETMLLGSLIDGRSALGDLT